MSPVNTVAATADELNSPSPSSAPLITQDAPGAEMLFAEIHLNGVNKGAYALLRTKDGDFLITGTDLDALGVRPPFGRAIRVEGSEYLSLRALGPESMAFDEAQVRLRVTLPPERLPTQVLDLKPGRPLHVQEPRDDSAFFNYRLVNWGEEGQTPAWSLNTELGIRFKDLFLHSESAYLRSDEGREEIRYGTRIIHENRDTLQRLVVGDFVASSGQLGRAASLGGISFSKSFQIDPYFVVQPMAGFTSAVHSPSEVSVYIDGTPIRTETLVPGQFELKNLDYYGGQHDVELVVRDSFGREQHIVHPFYFAEQNLAAGLHDYSYNLGLLRPRPLAASETYEDWAFSAYHNYGVSNALTLGARGEAESGRRNGGPTAVWRSDRFGVFSSGFSLSDGVESSGWAATAGYTFRARRFSFNAAMRRFSPGYEMLGLLPESNRPREEWIAGTGLPLGGYGNLSVGYHELAQYQGPPRKAISLGFSRHLGHGFDLISTLSREYAEETSNTLFLMLGYDPGGKTKSHFFQNWSDESTSQSVQVGTLMPINEGVGYRVVANRNRSAAGESHSLAPELQYNGPYGVYAARLQAQTATSGGPHHAYQWSVGGGMAYVGNAFSFSRPVTDSFGLVQVGELSDVRVYQGGQEIGRTDEKGRIFLPNLGSYRVNRVAIDDRDVPVDFTLNRKEMDISPPLRSGSLIRFDVARMHSVMGRLRVKVDGKWREAEYGNLTVNVDGEPVTVPVARDGEFYVENLKPGRYKAQLETRGRRCDFDLAVDEPADPLVDVGVLNVCEIAP